MTAKQSLYSRHPAYFTIGPPSNSAAPRALGVNDSDITMLTRETGVNRPGTKGGALLVAARSYPEEEDVSASYNGSYPSPREVKFSEPVSVA